MIKLGIIGADCAAFRSRYLPLFEQLKKRVQVVAVYDAVLTHAEQVASLLEAKVSCSFQQLVDRDDIHGLLILSSFWSESLPIAAAMLRNKPLFCSQTVWQNFSLKEQLQSLYRETGATVVIESECRYWASILRARELLATQLGEPYKLIWNLSETQSDRFSDLEPVKTISVILDGICFLLQRSYLQQESVPNTEKDGCRFSLMKRENAPRSESIPILILQEKLPKTSAPFLLQILCDQGMIEIHSPTEMTWRFEEASNHESLNEEQSAIERQLDHFCRHVGGGLIPLHNLTNATWNDHQTKWLFKKMSR